MSEQPAIAEPAESAAPVLGYQAQAKESRIEVSRLFAWAPVFWITGIVLFMIGSHWTFRSFDNVWRSWLEDPWFMLSTHSKAFRPVEPVYLSIGVAFSSIRGVSVRSAEAGQLLGISAALVCSLLAFWCMTSVRVCSGHSGRQPLALRWFPLGLRVVIPSLMVVGLTVAFALGSRFIVDLMDAAVYIAIGAYLFLLCGRLGDPILRPIRFVLLLVWVGPPLLDLLFAGAGGSAPGQPHPTHFPITLILLIANLLTPLVLWRVGRVARPGRMLSAP